MNDVYNGACIQGSHVHCWETGHSFIYRYHGELMSVTDSRQQGQQPKIEIVAHVHIQAGNNQELAVQVGGINRLDACKVSCFHS